MIIELNPRKWISRKRSAPVAGSEQASLAWPPEYRERMAMHSAGISAAAEMSAADLLSPPDELDSKIAAFHPTPKEREKESSLSFITDLESFASKVEKELEKLWKKAPTLVQVAETTLEYCIPLIETAISIIDPAAEAAAVTVLNGIEQKLIAVKGVITAVGTNLTVANVLSGIQADLSDFLAATDIKGTTAIADLKLVLGELDALIDSFESASASTATTTAAAA